MPKEQGARSQEPGYFSSLDGLVGEHTVVDTLAPEHVLPLRDVGLAADHRLDDAEVLDVLGAADDDGPDDPVTVEKQLPVDVRGRVVEDDRLESGAVAELADGGGGKAEQLGDVPAQAAGVGLRIARHVGAGDAALVDRGRPDSVDDALA